jgi:hypothetical protein
LSEESMSCAAIIRLINEYLSASLFSCINLKISVKFVQCKNDWFKHYRYNWCQQHLKFHLKKKVIIKKKRGCGIFNSYRRLMLPFFFTILIISFYGLSCVFSKGISTFLSLF